MTQKETKFVITLLIASVVFFSCGDTEQHVKNETVITNLKQTEEISDNEKSANETLSCTGLSNQYSSYSEAVTSIKSADFKIKESINTSRSSWVRGASFYSCDGETGFFIIKTDKQDYLYSNLPTHIWEGFKNADSFGSYYDRNIKNKYAFILN